MKTVHRTRGTRALSLGCLIFFAFLESLHLARGGEFLSFGGLFLTFLLALSLGATILNLGDRYRFDEEGIAYGNPLLARIGVRLDRRVGWDEVVSFRAHRGLSHGRMEDRPSALFLDLVSGKRFVIDSVEDFEEVRRLVSDRVRPDRPAPSATEKS